MNFNINNHTTAKIAPCILFFFTLLLASIFFYLVMTPINQEKELLASKKIYINFQNGNNSKALEEAQKLYQNVTNPDYRINTLRTVINLLLLNNRFSECYPYFIDLLKLTPQDQLLTRLLHQLLSSEKDEQIKYDYLNALIKAENIQLNYKIFFANQLLSSLVNANIQIKIRKELDMLRKNQKE